MLVADWSRLELSEPNAGDVTRKIGPLYFINGYIQPSNLSSALFIGLNLPTRVGLTDENKPKFTKVIPPPPPKSEMEEMNVTTPHPIRKGWKISSYFSCLQNLPN